MYKHPNMKNTKNKNKKTNKKKQKKNIAIKNAVNYVDNILSYP